MAEENGGRMAEFLKKVDRQKLKELARELRPSIGEDAERLAERLNDEETLKKALSGIRSEYLEMLLKAAENPEILKKLVKGESAQRAIKKFLEE